MNRDPRHVPVLMGPALQALAIRPDGVYLDGTFGRGGHSRGILMRLGPDGKLVVVDRDPEAIDEANRLALEDSRVTVCHDSFGNLQALSQGLGLAGRIDGILLDLGVSSPQLDEADRGFSFAADGPLDMRMDPTHGRSAAEWLAQATVEEISRVLRELGEERFAGRIARAIVNAREQAPITRTSELSELVRSAVPRHEPGLHPATRTFQAIRIHINGELDALDQVLEQGIEVLAPGGRFVVISFHSLEDRRVKHAFRSASQSPPGSRRLPMAPAYKPRLRLVGGLVRPDHSETDSNPRARSARMRVAEKLAERAG